MAAGSLQEVFDLAVQLQRAGDLQKAAALYSHVLQQQPAHFDALHHLGILAAGMGRYDVGADLLHKAVAARPDSGPAYNDLGNVLRKSGALHHSIAAYQQAIKLIPDFPEAFVNLGIAYREIGQLTAAIAAFQHGIELNPQSCEAHGNLGNALAEQGSLNEAIAMYDKAIALKPDYAEAHRNRGMSLRDLGRIDEAITAFRSAIRINPAYADAHYDLSFALLLRGDFTEGWEEYEWRWDPAKNPHPHYHQPEWDGSTAPDQTIWDRAIRDRTILVHAEQGFGDVIQFARYIPLLAGQGARVVVECQPELQRLLQGQSGVSQVIARGQPLPAFDVHCPVGSLPRLLRTSLHSIPATVPYLTADAELVESWRQRMLGFSNVVKAGLAWAGNPAFKNDRLRSPRQLSLFAPLSNLKNVQLFSLQKGDPAKQTASPPAGMNLIDWTGGLADFADTAALIDNLDLVISSDTAVAHLAGAMGKPVWLLLPFAPDWRWLLDRPDTPWYPRTRLYRQPRLGDWQTPIGRITKDLHDLTSV